MKMESQEAHNPIFINGSFRSYYKRLLSKCKRLWTSKYIHTFWVSNGSVKIKVRKRSNQLFKGKESESNQ